MVKKLDAHQYDQDGFYAGVSDAFESPLEPGLYLLPAGCTWAAPPKQVTGGKWPKFNGNGWDIVDDMRASTIAANEAAKPLPPIPVRDPPKAKPDDRPLLPEPIKPDPEPPEQLPKVLKPDPKVIVPDDKPIPPIKPGPDVVPKIKQAKAKG